MPDRKRFPNPPDQAERELILNALNLNLLVEAAAGTGKTTSMVGRMVALLRTGACVDIRRLVAVTFTRKAAAELRGRFQVELERSVLEAQGEERERLRAALAGVTQCFVGTIHAFCARLLRERPVEAGVAIGFQELEEQADARLRSEAWEAYCANLRLRGGDSTLGELEGLGVSLDKLKPFFSRFADFPDVDEWPRSVADDAVFEKIEQLGERLAQFIAQVKKIAPHFPEDTGTDRLIDDYKKLLRMAPHFDLKNPVRVMALIDLWNHQAKITQKVWTRTGVLTADDAKAEKARWDAFREDMVIPLQQLWCERRYGPILDVMARVREVYDQLRADRGLLNYQDLLLKAAALLRAQPHIRRYFARRYTHLLVDEFHDTDPIQAEMMLLLTADDPEETTWRAARPRPGSLFVVGDPKQSIYRFRRADIVTYNEVKAIIATHGRVVRLWTNFRSSAPIIEWVNRVFGPAADAPDVEDGPLLRFSDTESPQSPAYVPVASGRTEAADGQFAGLFRLEIPQGLNQKEAIPYEADLIARTIRGALDTGMPISRTPKEIEQGKSRDADPGDFMIVTYNSLHLSRYGQALQALGIPHQVTGGTALNQVAELGLLYRCLKAVVYSDNPVALVGVLRSELFGVSDAALFAFKQAGGRFSFRADVPAALSERHGAPIREAFRRLARYASWLATLPHLPAFERILGDLGLIVRAGLRDGGHMEAGSLAKALEILRADRQGIWSASQLLDRLGALASAEEKVDGISARPENQDLVRVMNLHKVKGLEAPVVFLACPYGDRTPFPGMHVDRSENLIAGYMPVQTQRSAYHSVTIALPPDWDTRCRAEAAFERAEHLRLRYVAATRAGSAMVITDFPGKNQRNPWKHFISYLPEGADLPDPGEQSAPERTEIRITPEETREALGQIENRLVNAIRPTHEIRGAKAFAMAGKSRPEPEGDPPLEIPPPHTDHGMAWGSVIHRLLEVAMQDPTARLMPLAQSLLEEYELDRSLAPAATATAGAVIASDIWQQAKESALRFTEVPFLVPLDERDGAEIPTVVRGTIDLIFKNEKGWVLIDYKTDRLDGTTTEKLAQIYGPQVRLYAKCWERCTGEKVVEGGLLFTRTGQIVEVVPGVIRRLN